MAIKDGKKVVLSDVVEEAKKAKPHKTIQEATYDVFGDMPTVINETMRKGKEKHKKDFFIEVLVRSERMAGNAIHPFLFIRKTCPLPKYRQMAFHYHRLTDTLRLLWALPDQWHAHCYVLDNGNFPQENVQFVLDYNAGKLKELADNINKSIKE